MLYQLNLAHILVPIFNLLQFACEEYNWDATDKVLETISIMQYQTTIFYAQYYQMNSKQHKMVGLNMWFIIEIMSFYGYILAGVIYIFI